MNWKCLFNYPTLNWKCLFNYPTLNWKCLFNYPRNQQWHPPSYLPSKILSNSCGESSTTVYNDNLQADAQENLQTDQTEKCKLQHLWMNVQKENLCLIESSKRLKGWNKPEARSSHRRCSMKKLFLKVLQNSRKNTCVGVFFLINFYHRRDSDSSNFPRIFQNFWEYLFSQTSNCSQMIFKIVVLKNFAIFTGQILFWKIFFRKLQACNLYTSAYYTSNKYVK